ncbi:Uncharacterised protein [Mycobacteroides abscessus subsp. massiliense]|nr:Uncharacterised protein [Mycobacteroides abscessus subsp. massiliense]
MGARGPHLLAVDDPFVAVAYRAGGQAREVGTGPGLTEQLTPELLTGEQRAQNPLGQRGLPVREHCGCCHAVADHVDKQRVWHARRAQDGVGNGLERGRRVEAAEADRELNPGQARVVDGAQQLGNRGRSGGMAGENLVRGGRDAFA